MSIAIVIPLLLIAPALWNGYPLLQYDTGGYLARWYEGYLVPSRSTAYGIYLHLGEASHFWLILGVQALSVTWIVQATLRVFGIVRPIQIAAIVLGLCATTALPVLTSLLLTDIFSGLSVLTLFLLVVHGDHFSKLENLFLFLFTSFAASTHSATLGVLLGVCCVGWIMRHWLPVRLSARGLIRGSLTIVSGAAILLACNFALSGRLAWTPGGSGVAFGRLLQDGLVKRYLDDHCSTEHLKLCPYRNELPQTGDDFLWGKACSMTSVNSGALATRWPISPGTLLLPIQAPNQKQPSRQRPNSLFPSQPVKAPTTGWPTPTASWRAICHRKLRRCGRLGSSIGNLISRLSIWFTSPLRCFPSFCWSVILAGAAWRRKLDDVALMAGTVALALFGNALLCGVLSGPHDRYGARMVWIATLVVVIAGILHRGTRRPEVNEPQPLFSR